jgi:hypothetical protein
VGKEGFHTGYTGFDADDLVKMDAWRAANPYID